jgi:predicted PurR-regulated permease PerM
MRTNQADIAVATPSLMQRTVVVVGVATAALLLLALLWYASQVLLLVFAGVLLAVFLNGTSAWLRDHTPLSYGWALSVVVLMLLAAIALAAALIGPQVATQVNELRAQLPQALGQIEEWLAQYGWTQQVLDQAPSAEELAPSGSNLLRRIGGIFSTTLGALGSFVIILFVGLYMAVNPLLYRDGLLWLVPSARRARLRAILDEVGGALRGWLIGQLVAMATIGTLTTLGLWLLGMPLALTLGLLAALLSFIPNIGPTLALVPALLLALLDGPTQLLWVLALYLGVQALESYLITPLIQQRAIDLPPALLIIAQLLMGVLSGGLGLILAAPLTAAALVLVKRFYVEDVLGDDVDAAVEEVQPPVPQPVPTIASKQTR